MRVWTSAGGPGPFTLVIFQRALGRETSLDFGMLMWVLAVVLVGGFAVLGFQMGGVRAAVGFVGAMLGLALATVIGGIVAPLLPKLGVQSLTWMLILPALVGFGLVWLASIGASFAAHRPVELHFKYREDDTTRQAFERMNAAIGMFVGMLTGVILLFAVSKPIYSRAYLTTQLHSETEPAPIGLINSVRNGMAQTGWDRTFAPLDRTSPKFIEVSDLLGLIYANAALTNRIYEYPPFLALVETAEVSDALGDPEYLKLIQDQAGFTALLSHPKTQAILNNGDVQEQLAKLDLVDLRKFLETGKSPEFDEEKLLGRWQTDMAAIVTDARRKRANLALADLKNLRTALNAILSQAKLTVYPDGKFALRVPAPSFPTPAAPTPADGTPAATGTAANPYLNPALAQRYGLPPQGAPAGAAPAAPVNPGEQFQAVVNRVLGKIPALDTQGTWTRSGDRFTLTFNNAPGETREATLQENGRFVVPFPEAKLTLVFIPAS